MVTVNFFRFSHVQEFQTLTEAIDFVIRARCDCDIHSEAINDVIATWFKSRGLQFTNTNWSKPIATE